MDHAKFHDKPLLNSPLPFVPDTWIDVDGVKISEEAV